MSYTGQKRTNYISWDEYFMGIAMMSSHRSKDPNSQVGVCIVDVDKKIVGVGYNGFPKGINDDDLPWSREGTNELEKKYYYVMHGETNAITNSNVSLKDCTVYTTLFPCNDCAKCIIQSGITDIIYLSDKYHDKDFIIASKKMFDMTGVKYRPFDNGNNPEKLINCVEDIVLTVNKKNKKGTLFFAIITLCLFFLLIGIIIGGISF